MSDVVLCNLKISHPTMEEQDLTVFPQGALSSAALSGAMDSMEHNLHHTPAYWEDLM